MSRSLSEGDEPELAAEINVVPLADVSLVLLIIVLVLAPMRLESTLHLQTAGRAPEGAPAAAPAALPPELVLVVDLGPSGYAVSGKFFTERRDFREHMTRELSARDDRKVFLAPHPEAAHGLVVDAMEDLKSCGAQSVALVQSGPQ